MFGRSGQMFPRQRAYHDAMYEEEYGSEGDVECCRGRGGAVLCWCFSVLLLVGLAASVVITVFFVLKSRNAFGSSTVDRVDDVDLFYGFNRNKFDSNESVTLTPVTSRTTTEVTVYVPDEGEEEQPDFTLSKESSSVESFLAKTSMTKTTITTTTTATPTKRKNLYSVSHSTTSSPLPSSSSTTTKATTKAATTNPAKPYIVVDHDTRMATVNPPYQFPRRISNLGSSVERPPNFQFKSEETKSNERWSAVAVLPTHKHSSSEQDMSTSTTHAHVLFSMPPSTNQNSPKPTSANQNSPTFFNRRRNRGPQLTSFSTSTEKLGSGEADESAEPVIFQTSTTESLPAIPSTSSSVETSSTSRGNLLERIIKNLAPKFKNKTEILSSFERFSPANSNTRVYTTIRTRMTTPLSVSDVNDDQLTNFGGSAAEVLDPVKVVDPPRFTSAINIVDPPKVNDLQPKPSPINIVDPPKVNDLQKPTNSSEMPSSEFLDVLVGADDVDKRLVTKETSSGIITSAILPSWYVNDTVNDVNDAVNNTVYDVNFTENDTRIDETLQIPVGNVTPTTIGKQNVSPTLDEFSEPSTFTDLVPQYAGTGFGQYFVNMFKASSTSSPNDAEPNRVGNIVNTGSISEVPVRPTSFHDVLKELSIPPSTFSPLDEQKLFHGYGGGYFEHGLGAEAAVEESFREEEEEGSENFESTEDDEVPAPSHIIEVDFGSSRGPDTGNTLHRDRQPLSSASEIHPQVAPPPVKSGSEPNSSKMTPILKNSTAQRPISEQSHTKIQKSSAEKTRETENKKVGAIFFENKVSEDQNKKKTVDDEKIEPSLNHVQIDGYQHQNHDVQNFFFERQPVSQLDENLFFQIPTPATVKLPLSQQHKPAGSNILPAFSTILPAFEQKFDETEQTSPQSGGIVEVAPPNSNLNLNSSGFHPPEPIDFHSNVYNFKPSGISGTSSGFVPVVSDTWRPVLYSSGENRTFVHNNFQSLRDLHAQQLQYAPNSKVTGSILPSFAEALKLRPTTTVALLDQSAEGSHWSNSVANQRAPFPPLVPSQPIPSPPLHSGRIKFPSGEDQDPSPSVQHGKMIDRTKYLHRPAPPPIVMRRHPLQALLGNRHRNFRNPGFLQQQQQQVQQQIQQQRMLKERLFQQQQGQRYRDGSTSGAVHWPNDEGIRRNGQFLVTSGQ